MVGQQHVLKALVNALDHDRLHHAFLFTGTRGVGKTTIARILAKSLNCERGVGSQPCGECSSCVEIDEGRFVDLIEVDAASNTKVDDTRELLDNVQYAPTRARYKVYLIDEVHMLSGHSFNALLKTLEEPPPHVKFLLATTDPQKLPVTVLSRCLQFNLKRLPPDLIEGRLAYVLGEEGIESEPAALALLSRAADGSMRDALSLLDQAIAFCGGRVDEVGTREMLGTIDRGGLLDIVGCVVSGDATGAMTALQALLEQAADPDQVLDELASTLQRIAMLQVVPGAAGDDDAGLVELAERSAPEYVQLCYQIAVMGRRDLPLAPEPRAGLEMVVLRMLAFRVDDGAPMQTGKRTVAVTGESRSAPVKTDPVWLDIVESLQVRGAALELAKHCVLSEATDGLVVLTLDSAAERLRTDAGEKRLREALARHYGHPVKLRIDVGTPKVETPARTHERNGVARVDDARERLAGDPKLRSLTETFGAEFDPEAVRPIERG